jgi:group I intron endonuclease
MFDRKLIPCSSGIYVITNQVTGKVYIGQSLNLRTRCVTHYNSLTNETSANIHLQSSWKKYGGSSFSFSVLELCSPAELDSKELHWISSLKSHDRLLGYNAERFPRGTGALSAETRRKISENNSHFWKGKHLSSEHRRKQSEALAGVPKPPLTSVHIENLCRSARNRWTKEEREARRLSQTAKWADPEYREKLRKSHSRPRRNDNGF